MCPFVVPHKLLGGLRQLMRGANWFVWVAVALNANRHQRREEKRRVLFIQQWNVVQDFLIGLNMQF